MEFYPLPNVCDPHRMHIHWRRKSFPFKGFPACVLFEINAALLTYGGTHSIHVDGPSFPHFPIESPPERGGKALCSLKCLLESAHLWAPPVANPEPALMLHQLAAEAYYQTLQPGQLKSTILLLCNGHGDLCLLQMCL